MTTALHEPEWLAARRERAVRLSGELELPSFRGVPGWEFTDLKGLDLDAYEPVADGDPDLLDGTEQLFWRVPRDAVRIGQIDATTVGVLGEVPEGVTVMTLAEAVAAHPQLVERHLGEIVSTEDPFVARNEATWTGGLFVHVAGGVTAPVPIVVSTAQAEAGRSLGWRTLIVLEEGAEAEVWEQYLSADADADTLLNTVVELAVGQAARLRYVNGQALGGKAWVFGNHRATVARDGSLDWVAIGFGAARGRVRMETELAGEGAEARVTGAYATDGRQHLEYDTTQEHAAPNTNSDLAFRGVLQGRSTAVWRGMIRVDEGAQRIDAFQESRNLLLSKRAHADAIPGLEILANDVRCTHAAAIAQIDPAQLFYLMSRGLDRHAATRLVIEGFLQELVERFAEGPIRDAVGGALERRLETLLG